MIILENIDARNIIDAFYFSKKNIKRKKKKAVVKDEGLIIKDVNKTIKYQSIPAQLDKNKFLVPHVTSHRCKWDHHTFTSTPIGCPLKYVRLNLLTQRDRDKITALLKTANIPIQDHYYETEGIFCSLPCVRSYIRYSHKLYHRNSSLYVSLLSIDLTGTSDGTYAPHWELLDVYGGPLSIDKFRSTNLLYESDPNVKKPIMLMCSLLYEEREVV